MKETLTVAAGFNPIGLTDAFVGEGWRLLNEGDSIQPGDGFKHPDYDFWTSYECRPDIFRGNRATRCPVKEFVHTWPWRRKTAKRMKGEG